MAASLSEWKEEEIPTNLIADEAKNNKCMPCSFEDKKCDAFYFCIQCVEHLCQTCGKDHRKIKLTRSHVLLEGNEMPKDGTAFEEMAKLTFCKSHAGREVEFKCDSHNEFVCSLCIRQSHRTCDNVVPVTDISTDKLSFKSDYFEKHFALKKAVETELESKITTSKIFETGKIEQGLNEAVDELNSMAQELNTENSNIEIKLLENDITKLKEFLNDLNQNVLLVDSVLKYGSNAQLTILSSSGNTSLTAIQHHLEGIDKSRSADINLTDILSDLGDLKERIKTLKEKLIAFKIIKKDHSQLQVKSRLSQNRTLDVKEKMNDVQTSDNVLPEDDLRGKPLKQTLAENIKQLDVDNSSEFVEPSLFECTVSKDKMYDMSVWKHSSKDCAHVSALIFDGGYMMFADRSNNVLKLISKDFQLRSYIHLEVNLSDIALIRNNLVAVATTNAIIIFSVCCSCSEIKQIKEFKTRDLPCSVTPLGHDLAILFSGGDESNPETFVQIRSMDNKILKNIVDFTDTGNVKIHLEDPLLIRAANNDRFMILNEDQVNVFDCHGQMKRYFKPGYLERVYSLAYDTDNNIYVCDVQSSKVYQISSDFSKHREIISDLEEPACIVYNPVNKMLIVGCWDSNFIHTYRLS